MRFDVRSGPGDTEIADHFLDGFETPMVVLPALASVAASASDASFGLRLERLDAGTGAGMEEDADPFLDALEVARAMSPSPGVEEGADCFLEGFELTPAPAIAAPAVLSTLPSTSVVGRTTVETA